MTQIQFSPDVDVELLTVEPVEVELIELDAGFGSSLYQALQAWFTLDGGRPHDNMTNIVPLDGGRASESISTLHIFERIGIADGLGHTPLWLEVVNSSLAGSDGLLDLLIGFESAAEGIGFEGDLSSVIHGVTFSHQADGFLMGDIADIQILSQDIIDDNMGFVDSIVPALTELFDDTNLTDDMELDDE